MSMRLKQHWVSRSGKWQNVRAALLNRLDGWSLTWDRWRCYVQCGSPRSSYLDLRCDLPKGHRGSHKDRAFLAKHAR